MDQKHLQSKCCGCTSCVYICPVKAISMAPDAEGFLRPNIDASKCIDCQMCIEKCAYKGRSTGSLGNTFYAVKAKNKSIVENSSSGGFFYHIASYIIQNGGSVYGAAYNWDNKAVEHIRIAEEKNIPACMGSKYVQSEKITYNQVSADLKNNHLVLFTGCPCQIDALKQYLHHKHIDSSKLITCDVICHGVPSSKIWRAFVSQLEKQLKGDLRDYKFRYKSAKNKWGTINSCALINGKKYVNHPLGTSFMKLYFGMYITRDECTQCPYASLDRVSDLTMADCWGIETALPGFNDSNGVSLIMINTKTGEELFKKIENHFEYSNVDINKLNQPHLYSPPKHAAKRTQFWEEYHARGYIYVAKKYGINTLKKRMLRILSEYKTAITRRLH